jgi:hypothetical protein
MCASLFSKSLLLLAFVISTDLAAAEESLSRDIARTERQPSILVTGTVDSSAPADQAVVRLGMTAQNSRAAIAQAKVNEVIQKTLDAIEKAGVKRQSVHTARLSLTPLYSDKTFSSGPGKISAFRADNVIEVTVDDVKLIGEIIDAALGAGANEVQSVGFRVKDEAAERATALAAAAEQAKSKAESIAKTLGVSLGEVLEAEETSAAIPFRRRPGELGLQGGVAPSFVGTPVEAGEVRVQATVVVRYKISERAR